VAFGPQHRGSRDALLLLTRGGGAAAGSAEALAAIFTSWLGDESARAQAGERARALVRSGVGAAERSLSIVERLLLS
jgi:3-deoxy-D-manno-octulosonic-acid transferase